MTNIYLVRHAQSWANTQDVYQGQSYDTDLSPLGVLQAKSLANQLVLSRADKIITSPLKRTRQTAEFISQKIGVPHQTATCLIETNHGQWEGLPEPQIKVRWPLLYQLWLTHPSQVVFPGGEAFNQVQIRVVTWWKSLPKHQPLVIISHENIIQLLLLTILNYPLDDLWKFYIPNASITTLHVSDAAVSILDQANVSHLIDVK